MPLVNGKYYMNPAFGTSVERARLEAQDAQATAHPSPTRREPRQAADSVPPLSPASEKAIDDAAKRGNFHAAQFKKDIVSAASASGVDPNLLVGLAMRESSLNPSKNAGSARGLFQITPPRQKDLGIPDREIDSYQAQIPKVAAALGHAMRTFHGNADLAIASWTLGTTGAQRLYTTGGMSAVRGALLDKPHPEYGRVGPDYVDRVKRLQNERH